MLQRGLGSELKSARQKMSKVAACNEWRDQPRRPRFTFRADKTMRLHCVDLECYVCGLKTA